MNRVVSSFSLVRLEPKFGNIVDPETVSESMKMFGPVFIGSQIYFRGGQTV